jgi:hypothetical protein
VVGKPAANHRVAPCAFRITHNGVEVAEVRRDSAADFKGLESILEMVAV